uniref:Gypsy retrotransposon integrase-like protein 1 n=1 Tax=Gouania willdenowi TaxID=441366 RepID=A0A8C5GD01_GOUWI
MQRGGRSTRTAHRDNQPQMTGTEALNEGEEENGATGGVDSTEGEGKEPSLSDLVSLFRAHMTQQEAREARQLEENARQEHRSRTLQHQFQLLQLEVQARTSPLSEPLLAELEPPDLEQRSGEPEQSVPEHQDMAANNFQISTSKALFHEPRLERLTEEDDVEHFLITFERIAHACRWQKQDWVFHLIPLLSGKARGAYVNMDVDDSLEYDKVKMAILDKYDINPETYRLRFRSLEIPPDENPKELYARLKELYGKWINPKGKTTHEIGELIILEQYFRMLSPELQVWIKERNPGSAAEAAKMADVFVAARRKGQPWSYTAWERNDSRKLFPQFHQAPTTDVGRTPMRDSQSANASQKYPAKKLICYRCGMEGHTKPMCPKESPKITQVCFVPRADEPEIKLNSEAKMSLIEINGQTLQALIDSGSDQTLVHRHFLPPNVISIKDTVPVFCVHGDKKPYPTADVYIKVQGQTYLVNVGVADNLPFPAVLGRDLPVLFDLLDSSRGCNAAVTRAQSQRLEETSPTLSALPFYDADLETAPGKSRKSRRQKRQEKFHKTVVAPLSGPDPELPLGFGIPSNVIEMQQNDTTLVPLFQRAKEAGQGTVPDSCSSEDFFLKGGILYRQQGSAIQLVVPGAARKTVLTLGHSVPWAGHLGKHRTIARIKPHFYWPGLRADVGLFCKSCPQCQKTSSRIPSRAPLQPLPIISTPFERLGMDIVGPVERSKAGNRYMLVITDYATRYPEVFPLKSMKAKSVAFCLVQLFSRVGFPREILTDRGTNFMSTLLKQVYQLLGIRSLRTTPYHPQTDGLTERFNQTMKQMLRKFVNETGVDWDQWLPYLLFAYREVPQASTGFSPFELLYGHEVRGPLSLLKDVWEGNQAGGGADNIISYVVQMRDRLEKMRGLAQSHMAESQRRQKVWYDRSARQRSFNPGQKVLVLLPSDGSKLLAQWQGPFEVQRKIGQTTYQVSTPGRPRSSRRLHVNLLKEWVDRPGKGEVLLIRKVPEDEEMEEQYLPAAASLDMHLSHLPEEKQQQVRVRCNPEIFQKNPGRTHLVEHNIVLKEGASVRRLSYRIPERMLSVLKEEVDFMLSLGIIEQSKSEWCNPVVLVPKKDGSIRFCIDFRYLNTISQFDSYPTPRIDDMIERLGKAKYLTTIDLCKGYWQLPLAQHSRELTAFRTPGGLYQFTVMPFGLHGAPATFQRLMDQVLCEFSDFASAYLDDIVIYSTTWEDHLEHLEKVLGRLQSAGLTINPAKCFFAKAETEYLGFIIGNGLIKPQVSKIHAIESCPLPETRKQLRSFLGMAGFYHRFIPHFSARAASLTDRTGSKCPNKVLWTKEAEAAFRDIQHSMSKSPVLYSPDFKKHFILQTDASERGLGAVLIQESAEKRHPVAFISRKLFPREVRYSTVEKEALAVKWAMDSFKYYLLGREFTLETDHKALQWLEKMKDTNGRITRWYLAMQPFRFIIHHIPGRDNCTADYLSRCPSESFEGGECVMATATH